MGVMILFGIGVAFLFYYYRRKKRRAAAAALADAPSLQQPGDQELPKPYPQVYEADGVPFHPELAGSYYNEVKAAELSGRNERVELP